MEWTLPVILAIIGGILSIAGIAGLAAGYFKSSRGDKIITYQAREIELRDGSIARLEKDLAAVSAERDSLKEQSILLKDLAQGSPELKKVAKALEKYSNVMAKAIKTFTGWRA